MVHEKEDFFETFSPVVNWFSVKLIFTLALLSGWHMKQVDFVLAYPQAPIEFGMYMNLPKGIQMANGNHYQQVCLQQITSSRARHRSMSRV
jgi:hypothetical protein